jgi:zinc protease
MVTSGKKAEEVERAMDAVIEGLGKQGPTRDELERAKRRILLNVLGNLELLNGPGGESGRAGILQRFEHYLGNPGYLPQWVAAIERVTPADVERAVSTYLTPAHRVVVVTEPEKAKPGATP